MVKLYFSRWLCVLLLSMTLLVMIQFPVVKSNCGFEMCEVGWFRSSSTCNCIKCTNVCNIDNGHRTEGFTFDSCPCMCNNSWTGDSCDTCSLTTSSCAIGQTMNPSTCSCNNCSPAVCPSGQYRNQNSCTCNTCSTSCNTANGGVLQSDGFTNGSCKCTCTNPIWGGSSCNTCSLTTNDCSIGQQLNTATCQCDACSGSCSAGQYRNKGSCTCINCPNRDCNGHGTQPISNIQSTSCTCSCSGNWSGSSCEICSLSAASCPIGQTLNTSTCSCVLCSPTLCPSGQYRAQGSCTCNTCSTSCNTTNGGTLTSNGKDQSSCSCNCSPLNPWYGSSCETCDTSKLSCDISTQVQDTTNGKCECKTCPTCAIGSITTTGGICGCTACIAPWTGPGCTTCSLTSSNCPVGTILNSSSCSCVECETVCSSGQYQNQGSCSCNPCSNSCPNGFTLTSNGIDSNTCQCTTCNTCPIGEYHSSTANGECQCTSCNLECNNGNRSSNGQDQSSCSCNCDALWAGELCNICIEEELLCDSNTHIKETQNNKCQCTKCPLCETNEIITTTNNICGCQLRDTTPKILSTFEFPSYNEPLIKGAAITLRWSFENINIESTDMVTISIINAGFIVLNNNNNNDYFESLEQNLNDSDDELFTLLSTEQFQQQQSQSDQYSYYLTTVSAIQDNAYIIYIPMNIQSSENAQIRLTLLSSSIQTTTIKIDSEPFSISSTIPCTGCNYDTQQCQLIYDNNENKMLPQCTCKRGYVLNNNQCELTCHRSCEPNGKCIEVKDKVGIIIGSKCLCNDGYSGTNCNIITNKCPSQDLKQCNNRGTTYNIEQDQCTNQCTCDSNRWYGSKCESCYIYNDNSSIGCESPGTDALLTMSICSTIPNEQCKCLPGYYGDKCQYRAIYGTIYFHRQESLFKQGNDNNNNSNIMIDIDNTNINVTRSTSMLFLNQTNLEYISPAGKYVLEYDLALSLNIDHNLVILIGLLEKQLQDGLYEISATFIINSNIKTVDTISSSMNIQQSPTPTSLEQLYSSWSTLSNNYNTTRLNATEAAREFGSIQRIAPAYDPECKSSSTTTCPTGTTPFLLQTEEEQKGAKTSSTGSIVGIVLGIIIFIILLFVAVIFSIRYCKKNEKCCFAKEDKRRTKSTKSNTNDTNMDVEMTTSSDHNSTSTTTNNSTSFGRSTKTAVDLVEITDHNEKLPEGWSKQQHSTTGEIFYVNNDKMISQRHSPIDGVGGDDAASGW